MPEFSHRRCIGIYANLGDEPRDAYDMHDDRSIDVHIAAKLKEPSNILKFLFCNSFAPLVIHLIYLPLQTHHPLFPHFVLMKDLKNRLLRPGALAIAGMRRRALRSVAHVQ